MGGTGTGASIVLQQVTDLVRSLLRVCTVDSALAPSCLALISTLCLPVLSDATCNAHLRIDWHDVWSSTVFALQRIIHAPAACILVPDAHHVRTLLATLASTAAAQAVATYADAVSGDGAATFLQAALATVCREIVAAAPATSSVRGGLPHAAVSFDADGGGFTVEVGTSTDAVAGGDGGSLDALAQLLSAASTAEQGGSSGALTPQAVHEWLHLGMMLVSLAPTSSESWLRAPAMAECMRASDAGAEAWAMLLEHAHTLQVLRASKS
ncbi:hypothetical protein EON66_00540 [archaeon]|nr:MAG: hypothetical protein EON66_00540 [archaeon]